MNKIICSAAKTLIKIDDGRKKWWEMLNDTCINITSLNK